ncbi:MAG TPA: 1-deoxy-D-xylulose-5-phosphate reductoisomerase [Firmicutes bacterium]|nr:1-deoxy-D-xylulose-5-phosphate reductoisomerase [Bacillota bacterium]
MTHCISILGSTGSIGMQTLDVVDALGIRVAALAAGRNVDRIEQQTRKYLPRLVVLYDEAAAGVLRERLRGLDVEVRSGMDGLLAAAQIEEADTVLTAVVGMVGLRPTLAAIEKRKKIALANKETLVCAGELVMAAAARCGAEIVPVDSEHSAIFQCLQTCRDRGEVDRIILTCSGGTFYGKKKEEIYGARRGEALNNPNWDMGAKVTLDSATLMNKGLEVIEAMRLYHLPLEQVSVVIHRESIIHSMVEYCDGAVLAQLGAPDMRLPIQYALTHPNRMPCPARRLDLLQCGALTFAAPDLETFPCLRIAMDAARAGGTACAVLNGAGEAAASLFLQDKIVFGQIPELVEYALERLPVRRDPSLEEILEADAQARAAVAERYQHLA